MHFVTVPVTDDLDCQGHRTRVTETMSEKKEEPTPPEDADLEREILLGRKFSLEEAIGRLGGGNLMKGASPVTLKRQAELQLERYLESHLIDAEGALKIVLLRRVTEGEILLKMGYQEPLTALALFVEQMLSSEERLRDFVNDVDAQWGRSYYERPHFERQGRPPDPDDPYTFASVRVTLTELFEELRSG